MESSSEDSFTWTDTSSDSIRSHSISVEPKSVEKKMEPNNKHKEKRKAKELSNNSLDKYGDRRDTKLNVKVEKDQSCDESCNIKKKMVKLESESESDVPKKKKNIKKDDDDVSNPEQWDDALYGETNNTIHDSLKENETSYDQSDTSTNKLKKKKKKSKKKSEDLKEIDSIMDVDTPYRKNKSDTMVTTKRQSDTIAKSNSFHDESVGEISAIQDDEDHNLHALSLPDNKSFSKVNKKKSAKLYKSTILNQFKLDQESQIEQDTESVRKFSDRIMFEDEDSEDFESSSTSTNKEYKTTSRLRKFLKASSNLQLVSQALPENTIFSNDGLMWLVRCPKEVDIQDLQSVDLKINGKCKIKIGGHTYEVCLEEEQNDTATVLSMKHNKYDIKNFPLSGRINLRKRIPKAHFSNDNVMINNQTNFIPLPETKCRHPLFGSNYKKALKIPTDIADRLNPENNEEQVVDIEKRKKKKHKKNKSIPEYQEADAKSNGTVPKLELETVEEISKTKKKKRKHIEDEGPVPKRLKKNKHDPESAEAWESEQAIEQNLFDF